MSVPKHRLLSRGYPRRLIVQQQRYRPSDSNTNVDIKLDEDDAVLESPSSVPSSRSKDWKAK